jgi:hypothetical protein
MSENPEDEVEKDIKKLEERREHLLAAIQGRIIAKDDLPHLQQQLELTEWQLRALKNRPPESIEIPYKNRSDEIESENQFLIEKFPILNIPPFRIQGGPVWIQSPSMYSASDSITVSGTPPTLDFVSRVRDLGTPDAIDFGNTYILEYNQLQESQERPMRVRELLDKLNSPSTLERFDDAFAAYKIYKSDPKEKISAANMMRNLIDGVKGDLFDRARHWPKENMTWTTMSSRIAINGDRGQEHVTLDNQKRVKASLYARLSDVVHDQERGSITDLNNIWIEILDYIFSVLGLINL